MTPRSMARRVALGPRVLHGRVRAGLQNSHTGLAQIADQVLASRDIFSQKAGPSRTIWANPVKLLSEHSQLEEEPERARETWSECDSP